MVTVRGVNVFPSAIEAIVRRHPAAGEFRIELFTDRGMDALRCSIEADGDPTVAARVSDALHRDLGIRCEVTLVAPGSLPRFEGKARRFVRVK